MDVQNIYDKCFALKINILSRKVNNIYNRFLSKHDIRITQLHVLVGLYLYRDKIKTDISKKLQMDRTTLTRNVKCLMKNGWVKQIVGQDRREFYYELTAKAKDLLKDLYESWEIVNEPFLKFESKLEPIFKDIICNLPSKQN